MDRQPSSKKATTMIVVGLIVLAFVVTAAGPLFATKNEHKVSICLANVRSMVLACELYSGDYDGITTDASKWMDSIYPYTKNETITHDVEGIRKGEYGYAYANKASHIHEGSVENPASFPLVYDSTHIKRNAVGDLSTLPSPGRHKGQNTIGFLDGHAKQVHRG